MQLTPSRENSLRGYYNGDKGGGSLRSLTFWASVALSLPLIPLPAVADEADEIRATVGAVGYDDQRAYPWAAHYYLTASLPPAYEVSANPETIPLPVGQYTWIEVRITDASGQPIRDRYVSVDFTWWPYGEPYSTGGWSDSLGTVRALVPPGPTTSLSGQLQLTVVSGQTHLYEWPASALGGPYSTPVLIAPEDEWVEFQFEILSRSFFELRLRAAPSGSSDEDAQAFLVDVEVTRPNITPFVWAGYSLFSESGDLEVSSRATTTPIAARLDEPMVELSFPGASAELGIQGEFRPGDVRLAGKIARAGLRGDSGVGISIFGDPETYSLKLVSGGSFRAFSGAPANGTIAASAGLVSPYMGDWSRQVLAANAETLMLAGAASGNAGTFSVSRSGSTLDLPVPAGDSVSIVRAGDCEGPWAIRFDTTWGTTRPTLALALGENLALSDPARGALHAGTPCEI